MAEITTTVIVKNLTASPILVGGDIGITVPASPGQVEFTKVVSVSLCKSSPQLKAATTGGSPTLTLNNGTTDLTPAEAGVFFDGGGGGAASLDNQGQLSGRQLGEIAYEESDAQSDTAGGWETKLTLTTPAVSGKIWIEWQWEYWNDNGDKDVQVQVRNLTDGGNLSNVRDSFKKDTTRRGLFDFKELTFTGAAKSFDIRFRPRDGGTAYMRNCRMRVKRGRA
jgi:hypothetical protein